MTEPTLAQDLFKGRHFDREIIVLCVRWYLAFKLSSRDLVHTKACPVPQLDSLLASQRAALAISEGDPELQTAEPGQNSQPEEPI
jgi:hypothetical protein